MCRQIVFAASIWVVLLSCSKTSNYDNGYNTPPPPPPPPPPSVPKKWVVTTVAGHGEASFVNGNAATATFHFPEDVAVAADGSIYVTDVLNYCIRKISGGQVSTFAGGGGFDIVNGNATTARFKNPFSIAIDAGGNLFTTDDSDPRIRKTILSGEVSTYAGTATVGKVDGPAASAQFGSGAYNTIDAQGNVFISDGFNNSIRKISAGGEVTTIAPTFNFKYPGGIAVDKDYNLYVANRAGFNILKITPAGTVSIFAGTGTAGFKDGAATEAQFSADARDLVIDSQGNLYMSDDNRIRKITPQGVVTTIAGSDAGFAEGEGTVAKFNYPNGLFVDSHDKVYVADLNNNRIRKVSFE
jgi:hypothetical protein